MKKLIFTLALVAGFISAANAQVDGKAIGLRFGAGTEVSYQHPMGDANRLELDLGYGSWSVAGLTGIYHWVKDLSSVTDGLNWYIGPGLSLGYNSVWSGLNVGIAGQVGAEYTFDFPLQLSLDYRPILYVIRPSGSPFGAYDGVCLSARYKF